jgi:probable HAF family extracellular repeat protein
MERERMRLAVITTLGIAVLVTTSSASAQTSTALPVKYEAIDLGSLGGSICMATAVNNSGVIVGSSGIRGPGRHAFVYENGTMVDVGTLGGDSSIPMAINSSGTIVGLAVTAKGETHAAMWTREGSGWKIADLVGHGRFSRALGVNDSGDVVGQIQGDRMESKAFRWSKGVLTELTASSGAEVGADAIGPGGVVVGFLRVGPGGPGSIHACAWTNGAAIDLGQPWSLPPDHAFAIDETGERLSKVTVDGQLLRLMRVPGEKTLILGAWGGMHGVARAVNAAGVAVGFTSAANQDLHGFRWDVDGNGRIIPTDLGTLGGGSSSAYGINDSGWIVGDSETADFRSHAVLWRPVTEKK